MKNQQFKLGLIINPYAGIGGPAALKGSDGRETREKALAQGVQKLANQKAARALTEVIEMKDTVVVYTAAGEMGADLATELGFDVKVVYTPKLQQTEAYDSIETATVLREIGVDLIVFAGGDGTATDIYKALADSVPVLGIPAGCKIHSGVYAVSPSTAGKVMAMMISGEIVSVKDAEVRDIDENAFRQGKVISRQVGEMQVPEELRYIQAVKMGGKEVDELVIADIADYLREIMEENEEHYFVMGSGSTINTVMEEFGLENTLLGIDLVKNFEVIAKDLSAADLQSKLHNKKFKIVVTLIGGQGHILGRGNQQLSPGLVSEAGKENLLVVASKTKLKSLDGRPILVDSGDPKLDARLSGRINVITGFRDHVLYPITDYTHPIN
jgi:predicted polyphosphate/ATP-dependent NAD kinase